MLPGPCLLVLLCQGCSAPLAVLPAPSCPTQLPNSHLPARLPASQEGRGYGLLAPLIDRNAFRTSIRPPRRRRDPPGCLLLRIESGDESVRDTQFQGGWGGMVLGRAGQGAVLLGQVYQPEFAHLALLQQQLRFFAVLLPMPPPLTAGVLYAAAGTDPFELLDRGVAAAARLSGAQPHWADERHPLHARPLQGSHPLARTAACPLPMTAQPMLPCNQPHAALHCTARGCRQRAAEVGEGGARLPGRLWLVLLGCHVHK